MSDKIKAGQDRFDRVRALISEWYPDYMLVVREDTRGRMWALSNPDWALGACKRMQTMLDETERHNRREDLTRMGGSE